jgi:hypothetical protein
MDFMKKFLFVSFVAVIAAVITGCTDPSITNTGRNAVHGSDSVESANREIAIYFNENEVLDYTYLPEKWLYE